MRKRNAILISKTLLELDGRHGGAKKLNQFFLGRLFDIPQNLSVI